MLRSPRGRNGFDLAVKGRARAGVGLDGSVTRDQNQSAVNNDVTPDWLSDASLAAFMAEVDAPVTIAA
jgi:hypothetical protein